MTWANAYTEAEEAGKWEPLCEHGRDSWHYTAPESNPWDWSQGLGPICEGPAGIDSEDT